MRIRPVAGAVISLGSGEPAENPDPKLEAGALVVGAAGSLVALMLYASGQTKLAASIGATTIIVGTTIAVARTLSGDSAL